MMKKLTGKLAFLGLLALPALGWSVGAAGTVSSPYLELPMGARGAGMGEAFSGIANDVNALYYNPAGLTAMDATELQLMHLEGFGGIHYENLGLAVPAESVGFDVWGTIGISYTLVAIDDTPKTQETFPGSGVYDSNYAANGYLFTAGASVVTVSYAWQATKLYSVGASFKAINEKVDTANGWGLAGDVGILSRPEVIKGLSAGLTLQNVGSSPDAGASLPSDMRVGIGYDWKAPFTGEAQDDRLLLDWDLIAPVVPVDGPWRTAFGLEYTRWMDSGYAILRAGYQISQGDTEMEGVALGGGIGTDLPGARLGLDYAWVPFGILGNMQRISLDATFGAKPRVRPGHRYNGNYLYPPANVAATAGDRQARISWEAQKGRVDGYNLYMTYNPASGKWTRLNRAPITATSQTINGLYNGYKVYFAVSTLAKKSENLYQESDKSPSVLVVPQGAPTALPTARPAARK
jgi:hypothetical protein